MIFTPLRKLMRKLEIWPKLEHVAAVVTCVKFYLSFPLSSLTFPPRPNSVMQVSLCNFFETKNVHK